MSSACSGNVNEAASRTSLTIDAIERDCLHCMKIPNVLQRNITLIQEPQESLSFCFSIKTGSNLDRGKCIGYTPDIVTTSVSTYDLSLVFQNNLHEISHDYGYEIEFKVLVQEKLNILKHLSLASHKIMRTTKELSFTHSIIHLLKFSHMKLIHACFFINRFCVNESRWGQLECYSGHDVYTIIHEREFDTNVTLLVDNKQFRAHKYVLSLKSRVFAAMFAHNMLENQKGIVTIDNFEPNVVKAMLDFIYGQKIKDLPNILIELTKIAHEYELLDLLSECEEHLLFSTNLKNVARNFMLSDLYGLKNLHDSTHMFFEKHQKEVMGEESFIDYLCSDISSKNIFFILQLCADYEIDKLKTAAFDFVKNSAKSLGDSEEFMDLFHTHPVLMQKIFKYIHQ